MATWQKLLSQLADGEFHSGESLANQLGLSRTAVWKQISRLEKDTGLLINSVKGRGYRLESALDLLDNDLIMQAMSGDSLAFLDFLKVLSVTDSTNNQAASNPPTSINSARVWLAEHQSAGKGRRGRHWVSTFGNNLYLSLAWQFDMPMSALSRLSLVTGVAVAKTLAKHGLNEHGLKWPNDVLLHGRKLAGILVEASGEADGPATAVIGIGINGRIQGQGSEQIDQPWTDLASAGLFPSRNQLAADLISELLLQCNAYIQDDFSYVQDRWDEFDVYRDKPVSIISGEYVQIGVARGIAEDGGLKLETEQGVKVVYAGEVSLREAPAV